MNINFKRITISNFMSFGNNVTIDLSGNGYTLVSGRNENPDDTAKSNGSGKSSIWEALSWAITGETIRGHKNVTNIYGNDGALVDLLFSIDSDEYEIIRTKDHSTYKTNLKIFVNGEDKSGKGIRDGEKLLKDYLPDITSQMLGSVIILGQGLPQRFTDNTPAKRKEMLEQLSKSDYMVTDLKRRINARKNELTKDIENNHDKIVSAETGIRLSEESKTSLEMKLEALRDSSELEELIKMHEFNANELNESISSLNRRHDECTEYISDVNDKLMSLYSEKENRIDKANKENDYSELVDELSEISYEIKMKESEISKLENVVDVCPTCGQKLPNVNKIDTTDLHVELDSLCESYKAYNDMYLAGKNNLSNVLVGIEDEYKSLIKDVNDDISRYKKEMLEIDTKINSKSTMLTQVENSINKYNTELSTLSATRESILSSIEDNTNKINKLEKDLLYYNEEGDALNSHMEVISKFENAVKRDFRGYLLQNVIEYIDRKAKEYSEEVFGTNLMSFSLDGNNISISYDGKEYECLSGGEKQKVDIIVQFALRDMLCKYQNFSSNIIVLDELFDGLDEVGCNKILNLLGNKLTDVDSIFIITHHADISIPVDNEIVVVKGQDKNSYVL